MKVNTLFARFLEEGRRWFPLYVASFGTQEAPSSADHKGESSFLTDRIRPAPSFPPIRAEACLFVQRKRPFAQVRLIFLQKLFTILPSHRAPARLGPAVRKRIQESRDRTAGRDRQKESERSPFADFMDCPSGFDALHHHVPAGRQPVRARWLPEKGFRESKL